MNQQRPVATHHSTSHSNFLPSSFPLLPRLEDLADPPVDPWDTHHSLDSIINQSTKQPVFTPLPLFVPPIAAIDDKTLNIQSVFQTLNQQRDVLQTFHNNHQSIIDNQPILPSVNQTITQFLADEAATRSVEAANQLKACLDTIPSKFFDPLFNPIFEVLSFLDQQTNHAYTVYESIDQSNHSHDSYDTQRNRDANGELIDEDREDLINLNPYDTEGNQTQPSPQNARYTNHTVHNTAPPRKQSNPQTGNQPDKPVRRKQSGRSFLSYIVGAFSPAASNLRSINQAIDQSINQSTHLSVQQFSSLSLSPDEEARAAQLLATLTAFLDLLEITISSQINQSSQSFFNTLLTVYELHNDLTSINQSINKIREELRSLNTTLTVAPLAIVQSTKRRDRLDQTCTIMQSINQINQDISRINQLCEADQFASMLELMHQTRLTLYSEPFVHIKCLKGVDQSISQTIVQATNKLKAFFLRVAIEQSTDSPVPSPAPSPAIEQLDHQSLHRQSFLSSVNPCPSPSPPSNNQSNNQSINEDDGDIIYAVVQCLYHIKGLVQTVTAYREALLQTINQSIDQSIHGSVDFTRPSSPAELATLQPQSMNPSHKSSHGIEAVASPTLPAGSPSQTQPIHPSLNETLSPTPHTGISSAVTSTSNASPQRERTFTEALQAMLPTSLTNSHRPSFTLSSIAAINHPSNNQPTDQSIQSNNQTIKHDNPLHRQLSLMPFDLFAHCLRDIHAATVALLNRSVETSKIVVRAIEHVPSPLFLVDRQVTDKHRRASFVPEDLTSVALEIRHMFESTLDEAVATSERECVKCIDYRYSVNALQSNELMQLVSLMIELVIGYEVFISLPQSPLRASLASHCTEFVSSFHAHQLQSVIDHLNREQWNRMEITKDMQNFVDSGYTTPLHMDNVHSTNSSNNSSNNPTPQSSPSPPPSLTGARVLFVERVDPATQTKTFVKFPVVRSVLILMQSVACYLDLARNVPALTQAISLRLAELLQSFNTRVRVLILGAQALQTAGMKTITTTQLALCAQSLTFLTTQLHIIQSKLDASFVTACATRALRKSVGEQAQQRWTQAMQSVNKELVDQSSELIGKLCTIMTDLSDMACQKFINGLLNQPVDQSLKQPSTQSIDALCDPNIRTLINQTKSLNTSLTAVLSQQQRETLFENISRVYCQFMLTSIKRIDTSNQSNNQSIKERVQAAAHAVLGAFYSFPRYDHDLAQQLADATKLDIETIHAQCKVEEEKRKMMSSPSKPAESSSSNQSVNQTNNQSKDGQDDNKVVSDRALKFEDS